MADEGKHTCAEKEVLQKEAPRSGDNWCCHSSLVITVGDGASPAGHQFNGRKQLQLQLQLQFVLQSKIKRQENKGSDVICRPLWYCDRLVFHLAWSNGVSLTLIHLGYTPLFNSVMHYSVCITFAEESVFLSFVHLWALSKCGAARWWVRVYHSVTSEMHHSDQSKQQRQTSIHFRYGSLSLGKSYHFRVVAPIFGMLKWFNGICFDAAAAAGSSASLLK